MSAEQNEQPVVGIQAMTEPPEPPHPLADLAASVARKVAAAGKSESALPDEKGSFAVARGSGALPWTEEKPRASGMWWWWNLDPKCAPDMVEVRASDVLSWCGLGPTMHWPGLTRVRNVMTVGGVWAGPVNPPETPSAKTTANALSSAATGREGGSNV